MEEEKVFYAPGISLRGLADRIMLWLRSHDFETQSLDAPLGGVMIQARQTGTLRSALGLSSALTIVLTPAGENLKVEMGAARWADKIAVGAIGIIFEPLLVTAAYGAWRQSQLPGQITDVISQYISINQGRIGRIQPSPSGAPSVPRTVPRKVPIGASLEEGQDIYPQGPSTEEIPPEAVAGAGPEGNEGNGGNGGKDLSVPLQTACPRCGTLASPGSRYCSQCGASVRGPVPVEIR